MIPSYHLRKAFESSKSQAKTLKRKDRRLQEYTKRAIAATKIISGVDLPDDRSGKWILESYEIEDNVCMAMKNIEYIKVSPEMVVIPGKYTMLYNNNNLYMTDTPVERVTQMEFINNARGDILITGLGIGLGLNHLIKEIPSRWNSVTVIEKSSDVIKLVAPHYQNPKVKILKANAHTWKPTRKYHTIWHDIWPTISDENLIEMEKLRTKYEPFCIGWQGFWAEYMHRRLKRMGDMVEGRLERWKAGMGFGETSELTGELNG